MKLASCLFIALFATLAAAGPEAALAGSKSYCRNWAQDVANRNANAADVVVGTTLGALGGAVIGAALGGHASVGSGALIGGAGGAVVTGVTTNERWQQIYRRAYAECRAS